MRKEIENFLYIKEEKKSEQRIKQRGNETKILREAKTGFALGEAK